ncbi:MAG: tRNA-dihydrouridine synthase family protein [Nanoarchaeota archaeon]|nr:tRNA-dihydrouridine synthase family protein [Nanoarchaeota archaeon]
MEFPKLKNKLILAPMAEVTSLPFRLLCRKYGASMAYTEQISALAITRNSPQTLNLAKTSPDDSPVGLQLFGRNPDILIDASKKLHKDFDVIDLNMGCPSKKIVREGYGSALLKEKDKIKEIISSLTANIPKPITVKMRSGFKKEEALKLSKLMESAGCSAITIHARTQEQGYSGNADWNLIKQLKENLSIPIIGNGDVTDPISAEKMLNETKCDYIMIGRAARNNPFIFKQINRYFKTGEILKQSQEDKLKIFDEYLKLETNFKLIKLRCMDFTKGISHGAQLRNKLSMAKNMGDIKKLSTA